MAAATSEYNTVIRGSSSIPAGQSLFFDFLPPHGRHLSASQEIEVEGSLLEQIRRRCGETGILAYKRAVAAGVIEIIKSPDTYADGELLVLEPFQPFKTLTTQASTTPNAEQVTLGETEDMLVLYLPCWDLLTRLPVTMDLYIKDEGTGTTLKISGHWGQKVIYKAEDPGATLSIGLATPYDNVGKAWSATYTTGTVPATIMDNLAMPVTGTVHTDMDYHPTWAPTISRITLPGHINRFTISTPSNGQQGYVYLAEQYGGNVYGPAFTVPISPATDSEIVTTYREIAIASPRGVDIVVKGPTGTILDTTTLGQRLNLEPNLGIADEDIQEVTVTNASEFNAAWAGVVATPQTVNKIIVDAVSMSPAAITATGLTRKFIIEGKAGTRPALTMKIRLNYQSDLSPPTGLHEALLKNLDFIHTGVNEVEFGMGAGKTYIDGVRVFRNSGAAQPAVSFDPSRTASLFLALDLEATGVAASLNDTISGFATPNPNVPLPATCQMTLIGGKAQKAGTGASDNLFTTHSTLGAIAYGTWFEEPGSHAASPAITASADGDVLVLVGCIGRKGAGAQNFRLGTSVSVSSTPIESMLFCDFDNVQTLWSYQNFCNKMLVNTTSAWWAPAVSGSKVWSMLGNYIENVNGTAQGSAIQVNGVTPYHIAGNVIKNFANGIWMNLSAGGELLPQIIGENWITECQWPVNIAAGSQVAVIEFPLNVLTTSVGSSNLLLVAGNANIRGDGLLTNKAGFSGGGALTNVSRNAISPLRNDYSATVDSTNDFALQGVHLIPRPNGDLTWEAMIANGALQNNPTNQATFRGRESYDAGLISPNGAVLLISKQKTDRGPYSRRYLPSGAGIVPVVSIATL